MLALLAGIAALCLPRAGLAQETDGQAAAGQETGLAADPDAAPQAGEPGTMDGESVPAGWETSRPKRRAKEKAKEEAPFTIPQRYVLVDPANGLAIGGYDPVAYYVDRRPRLGKPRFEYTWSETIWRFVNEGNMAAFEAAPEIYAPQFGGHDARALAEDQLAPGDPRVWAIYHDRLYFFHSPARRFSWLISPDRHIAHARESWDKRLNFRIEISPDP